MLGKTIEAKMQYRKRDLELNTSFNAKDNNLVEFSVASSEPFFRVSEDDPDDGYYEVLLIGEENIDFSRMNDGKCPFLFEHDTEKQLGVVEKAYIADNKLKVLVKFSENEFPQMVLKDILSGIRRNVSIGYIVMETSVQPNNGDFPTVYITKWQPYECTSCTVPADPTVGYQRTLNNETQGSLLNMEEEKLKQPVEEIVDDKEVIQEENNEEQIVQEAVENQEEIVDETEEILAAGELADEEELAKKCISEKRSLKEFKQLVKNKRNLKGKKSMETPKKYSITKAIRSIWKGTKDAEYEMNLSHDAQRNLSTQDDHDLFVPIGQLRALGTGATNGGALVNTSYLPNEYVPLLRPELSLEKTGFHTIPSDGAPVSFAVMTSGATAAMYGLDGELADSEPAFSLKTLTPKKAGICVPIPFSLILQAKPEADAIVEEDMVNAIKELRDKMILVGSGASNEPTGIYATSGVNTVDPSGIYSWAGVVEAEKKIREHNVTGELYWVMNSNNKAKFETTLKDKTAGAKYLCEDNKIKDHEVVVNNFLADNQIILGDFSDVAVAEFGPLKVKVDDISLAKKQAIQIIMDMEFDCCVRRPSSFTITKS